MEGIFKKCSFFGFFGGNFPQQFLGDFFPGLKDFSKKSCLTNINPAGGQYFHLMNVLLDFRNSDPDSYMLYLRCGSSIWNSVSQPLLLQGSPAPMELYCVDLDYMSWVTQNGTFPNGQWWVKPPPFTTSSCSRKKIYRSI